MDIDFTQLKLLMYRGRIYFAGLFTMFFIKQKYIKEYCKNFYSYNIRYFNLDIICIYVKKKKKHTY